MVCNKCGTEFEGNYCPNCGNPVSTTILENNLTEISTSTDPDNNTESKVTKEANETKTHIPWYLQMWFISILFWVVTCIGFVAGIILFILRIKKYPEKRRPAIISALVQVFIISSLSTIGIVASLNEQNQFESYINNGNYTEALVFADEHYSGITRTSRKIEVYEKKEDYDSAAKEIINYCNEQGDLSSVNTTIKNKIDYYKNSPLLSDEVAVQISEMAENIVNAEETKNKQKEEEKALKEQAKQAKKEAKEAQKEAKNKQKEEEKALKEQTKQAKNETKQAKKEADKAQKEAEKAKAEAEQAKADAASAKAEAEKSKMEVEKPKSNTQTSESDANKNISTSNTQNNGSAEGTEYTSDNINEIFDDAVYVPRKDLMRNPDDYIGKTIKVLVRITQKQSDGKYFVAHECKEEYYETTGKYTLLSTGDEYYIYDFRIDKSTNIIPDDYLLVYGKFYGLEKFTLLINGAKYDIPSIDAYYVDFVDTSFYEYAY